MRIVVRRTASVLATLLVIVCGGIRLTNISDTVGEEHQSRSRDTLCVSADVRCWHLEGQYQGRHVSSNKVVAEKNTDTVMLPIDLPHQDDTDYCRNQPACHHNRSAVLELGGDESPAQDPDDLESSLRNSQSGGAERITD